MVFSELSEYFAVQTYFPAFPDSTDAGPETATDASDTTTDALSVYALMQKFAVPFHDVRSVHDVPLNE